MTEEHRLANKFKHATKEQTRVLVFKSANLQMSHCLNRWA